MYIISLSLSLSLYIYILMYDICIYIYIERERERKRERFRCSSLVAGTSSHDLVSRQITSRIPGSFPEACRKVPGSL